MVFYIHRDKPNWMNSRSRIRLCAKLFNWTLELFLYPKFIQ